MLGPHYPDTRLFETTGYYETEKREELKVSYEMDRIRCDKYDMFLQLIPGLSLMYKTTSPSRVPSNEYLFYASAKTSRSMGDERRCRWTKL